MGLNHAYVFLKSRTDSLTMMLMSRDDDDDSNNGANEDDDGDDFAYVGGDDDVNSHYVDDFNKSVLSPGRNSFVASEIITE